MFPFIPVDSQTGQFGDFGFPFHGLYTLIPQDAFAEEQGAIDQDRSFLLTNNGVTLGYPDWSGLGPHQAPFDPVNHNHRKFPNTQNSRKIVVPLHTYTRDPEREDGDLLNGVDFQSFAIANDRFIGGFANIAAPEGWIYPATDGSRWNITLTATLDAPDWTRWTIQAFPYGRLAIPNSFYGVSNVPDTQTGAQASYILLAEGASGIGDLTAVASSGIVQLDISSTGEKAAFGLGGGGNNGLYPNFNPNSLGSVANQQKAVIRADANRTARGPSAIWEVTLSGTPGVDFGVLISLVRNQATCAGNVVKNVWDVDEITQYWGGTYAAPCGDDPDRRFIRPLLGDGCGVGEFPVDPVAQSTFSLNNPSTNGPIATTCGWTRELSNGMSVITEAQNEYLNFKWWTFTDAGANDPWPFWGPASKEYGVGENVLYNGITFNCTVAHTSDPFKEPGVAALWTAFWEIPYLAVNHDVADVPVWAEATSYQKNSAVREGAADYWLAKGQFVSFDSGADPEQTNHDQPNVGDNFEAFWDGPFNVLLNPVWIADKLALEGWIIESTYTDPAIASQATITNARWECIRSHVTAPDNKPGVGANWPQYWEKAFSETSGATWQAPLIYAIGAKVGETVGGDFRLWEAINEHTATALNRPSAEDGTWAENLSSINCRAAVGQLESALNETAYHVNDHRTRTESIDFHVTDVCAGAFYTDADVLKIIETDAHYTRELSDTVFNSTWDWTDEMIKTPPPPEGEATGHIARGTSTCNETFEYKFRVDGVVKHTITFSADATANGVDDWTERFDEYPKTWDPVGTRTLVFNVDFVPIINLNETFGFADTIAGGATEGKMFDDVVSKSNWDNNNFVGGLMFKWIDEPYMDALKQRLEFGALNRGALAGAGLMNYEGGSVTLDAISAVDQYSNAHPFRTAREVEEGEPYPSLITCWYGRKLVSPFFYGRKTNSGIALDSQYLRVLRPDDMNWIQYGIYGPDAEISGKVVLDFGSPVNPLTTWLPDAIYGDDISCAYDPINKVIHRNSQYRVVYI